MRYKMQRKKRKGYGMRVPVVLLSARSIVYNSTPGRSSDSLHLLRLPGRAVQRPVTLLNRLYSKLTATGIVPAFHRIPF